MILPPSPSALLLLLLLQLQLPACRPLAVGHLRRPHAQPIEAEEGEDDKSFMVKTGPYFEENARFFLKEIRAAADKQGMHFPFQLPDDTSAPPPGSSGHGGRPLYADARPLMKALEPAFKGFLDPIASSTLRNWLPAFFLCQFGFADAGSCAKLLGTTLVSSFLNNGANKYDTGYRMPPKNQKGRCTDHLPPAPPPPPIPPPLPTEYETRGLPWRGHLLIPNGIPAGARIQSKSAAAHTPSMWPMWGQKNKKEPYRPDLDITKNERSEAMKYTIPEEVQARFK